MNLNRFDLMRRVCFAPEGGDGGGAPAAGGDTAAPDAGGDLDTKPSLATAAFAGDAPKPDADAAADPNAAPAAGEGDKPDGDAAAEADASPFELAPAEGLEAFAEDYSSYSKAGNDFLSANPNATAREALAFAAEYQAEKAREAGKAFQERFNGTIEKWESECVADPRIGGGNRAKYDGEVVHYHNGLRAIGTPELVKVLDESGLGSHPEIFAAFAKVGRSAQESPIFGGEGGKGQVSFADALYGKKG